MEQLTLSQFILLIKNFAEEIKKATPEEMQELYGAINDLRDFQVSIAIPENLTNGIKN